ncbi:MAG: hypothetical protein GY925_23620 [Actinomycetia bacterium]|nr:hypothetical protein [Actinomycetes bacterium]
MALLSKIIVIVSAGVSVAALVVALRAAAREVRIRRWLEVTRVAVGLGGVLLMGAITGVQTAAGLAIGAVAAGGLVGFIQGRQTIVSIRDSKLWAKRTVWGIVVFAAGLIAMQLAGLGSRTGAFRFGQAVALFSISVGIGLALGRPAPSSATPPIAPGGAS